MKRITKALLLLAPALLLSAPQLHAQRAKKKQPAKKQQPARRAPVRTTAPAAPAAAVPGSDSTFGSTTLEIIQVYKPEVKLPPKPQVTPALPQPETAIPALTYVVPPQTLIYQYTSLPLRPLALGVDTTTPPAEGYLKLGAGNLNTFYLDGGIAGRLGIAQTTLHLHHLSQKGKIAAQQQAQTGLEATIGWQQGRYHWQAFLEGSRNQYKAYGYDHDLFPYNDSLKRRYIGVRAGLSLRHEPTPESFGWYYEPRLAVGTYSAKFGYTENSLHLDVPGRRMLTEQLSLAAGLRLRLNLLNHPDTSFTNNLLQATVGLGFHNEDLYGRLLLRPTLGRDGMAYLLPDIMARYQLVNEHLFFKAGYQSQLLLNTLEDLTGRNPFLAPDVYASHQTRQDEAFAGLEAGIGKHLNIQGKVSWLQQKYLPMFVNLPYEQRDFGLLADPLVRAWAIEAGARYQVGKEFGLGLNVQFINYFKHTGIRVWHEPGLRATADVNWRILPGLNFNAYGTLLDKIYAPNATFSLAKKLDPVFDIGAGAEYEIVPHFSVFARVQNLLNLKYQRWQGYDSYGINIFGGIGLKL